MAEYLGCSKGYVSQLLNGNFDHKLSKLVELSLAIGKAPLLEYKNLYDYIMEDDETYSAKTISDKSHGFYVQSISRVSNNSFNQAA